jgi:anti-sigma factor RsiW
MHPSESNLALYAGGELGWWARMRTARHLRRCEGCSRQVEEFRGIREWTQSQDGMPAGIDWGPLAAELKANIRLGLAAGQCVAPAPRVLKPVIPWRAAVVLPVLLVVVVGWWLQSWPPPSVPAVKSAGPRGLVLTASPRAIELQQGDRAFALLHPPSAEVTFSVSGQEARSRYVDSETGYVTISHVYTQ